MIDWKREMIPAWYELGVRDIETLLLHIHELAMGYLCSLDWVRISDRSREKLGPFIHPTENNWGFGSVVTRVQPAQPEWRSFAFCLPKIRVRNEEPTLESAYPLRETLSLIFGGLWLFSESEKQSTNSITPQL